MTDEDIKKIKRSVVSIDWKRIASEKAWNKQLKSWKINSYHKGVINLDPYICCSKNNPLYLHYGWLDYLYNDLDLSDRIIAKVCNDLSHRTIGNSRKKFRINTKDPKELYRDGEGYLRVLMPLNYKHPQLNPLGDKRVQVKKHRIIMEKYLASKGLNNKCLINGKFLNSFCEVHHINQVRDDNRIKNLYLFSSKSDHSNAQRSLNDSFMALIKLNQLKFNRKFNRYSINRNFNYTSLALRQRQQATQNINVQTWENISEVKNVIKKINWYSLNNNWTITEHVSNQYSSKPTVVKLDPHSDCSLLNPLYKHHFWLNTIVNDIRFNMTDPRLAKLCGVSESTIYTWRWEKFKIQHPRYGQYRTIVNASTHKFIYIKVPLKYGNPFAKRRSSCLEMPEHRYVAEKVLVKDINHPLHHRCLFKGKFLKPECIVHHINLDPFDNRTANLIIVDHEGHNSIHANLRSLVKPLLKRGYLLFDKLKGFYHISL